MICGPIKIRHKPKLDGSFCFWIFHLHRFIRGERKIFGDYFFSFSSEKLISRLNPNLHVHMNRIRNWGEGVYQSYYKISLILKWGDYPYLLPPWSATMCACLSLYTQRDPLGPVLNLLCGRTFPCVCMRVRPTGDAPPSKGEVPSLIPTIVEQRNEELGLGN